MSISLVTYPVISSSGKVRNIFAGFDAVELEFKREDTAIISVTQGANNKILITITGDISSSLNVGEWVYLKAVGSTFTYDGVFQILDIAVPGDTEITVDGDYIESTGATDGYCNYKQNWYLESRLVDPENTAVKNYPEELQTDGNPNGEIKVNTSMLVDFLESELLGQSGQVSESRQHCKVEYREVWREDDTAVFTLIDQEPIIIIFAAENAEIESFVTGFDVPRMWDGYPFYINLLHSTENYIGERVSVEFDELNINQDDINTGNLLANFGPDDFGILQVNFADNVNPIDEDTRYIRFNASSSANADYETGDYNDNDYFTINTP